MENNNFKFKIYSKNNHGCKCGYMLILESSNSVRCSRHRGSQRITRYFFSVCFKVSLKQWLQYQNSSLCSTVGYFTQRLAPWHEAILFYTKLKVLNLEKRQFVNWKRVLLDSPVIGRTHSKHSFDGKLSSVLLFYEIGHISFVCHWNLMGQKPQGHQLMTHYLSSRTCIFARMNEAFVVGLM